VTGERIGGFGSALKDMLLQIELSGPPPLRTACAARDQRRGARGGQTEEFSNMKVTPALVLVAGLVSASPALAHAHLEAETPPADAVLAASPSALTLGFSEGLEIGLSGAILRGQDGRVIPTGGAVLAPNDDKKITVPLKGALSAGKYTVEWHALSKDGHATHGSYQFTVVP
jgi:copper resistance protein C